MENHANKPPCVEDRDLLEAYAEAGLYPNVSPCPVGCKFCYERHLRHFYPNLEIQEIRARTADQFDYYEGQLREFRQPAFPAAPVAYEAGTVLYHSASDFFCQGMSRDQLERVVAQNDRLGQAPYMNTTGRDLELETVRILSERYPDSFRVRLSVLTFNDDIKGQLIPRWPGSEKMKRMIPVLREGRVYLLNFGLEQTLADLDVVNACSNPRDRPSIVIAPIHYNSRHPPFVKSMARRGHESYEALIGHLGRQRSRWPNVANIFFHHPAEAFTWRSRAELRARLAPLRLGEGDLVLCSVGASAVMQDHVVRRPARVVAVRDGLGGSTTFTTTLSTGDFARELDDQRSRGEVIRRVLVPSPVWWVNDGQRCLNGGTVNELRQRFPEIEILCIDVPDEIVDARLTLDECLDYYGLDLDRTARLRDQGRDVLEAHAHPLETVTRRGYIRRFSSGQDEAVPLDPDALDRARRPVVVSYDELLVHRSGDRSSRIRRETALSVELEPRALERFRSLFIDGSIDGDESRSALYLRFADHEVPVKRGG